MTKTEEQDKLLKAYSRLTSIQKLLTSNIRGGYVTEQYVVEYHSALDQVEEAGFDLTDFRLPIAALERRSTGGNYLTGETYYSQYREVEHGLFLMKVQAVLDYFTLATQSPRRSIGFAGPSKN